MNSNLIIKEAIESGKDPHRLKASIVFNTSYENVTNEQRQSAKLLNFMELYNVKKIKSNTMRKLLFILLFPLLGYTQVGIATTEPTNTLDINGSLRVRSQTEGTVHSNQNGVQFISPYRLYATAVVDKSGTIYKQYGFSSVVNLGGGKYRFTFLIPMKDNDYIINGMARNHHMSYNNVTINSFDIELDSNSGQYDFNVIIFDLI